MIHLARHELPRATVLQLAQQTSKIQRARSQRDEAHRLWRNASVRSSVLPVLRSTLGAMAPGIGRCMYCGDSFGTDIEHYEPIKLRPIRAFDWLNHLLACSYCNSRQKQDKFPCAADGSPLLIDPTADDPTEHLHLALSGGSYLDLTVRGRITIDLLDLNRGVLVKGRRHALHVDLLILAACRAAEDAGDVDALDRHLTALEEQPLAEVAIALLAQAETRFVTDLLRHDPATLAYLRQEGTRSRIEEIFALPPAVR